MAHIPQVGVISTSLGALPRPVPRPLPGVTLPASPECLSPQSWGWLWGGWSWSRSLTRGWSMVWVTRVFEGVGVTAGRGVGCRVACSWTTSVSMACSTRVFDVVGVTGGRGVGCRVSCSRPLPGVTRPASPECPSPQSRGLALGGWRVACWWSLLVSLVWAFRVFEVVGVLGGRGVGCFVACSWSWLVSMGLAFRVFEVVVMFDGRGVGRFAGRRCGRWSWLFICSMTWAWLLAVV